MSADQQRPHGSSDAERGSEEEPIVFNDRRRIDPETGEPRVSAESAAEQAEDGDALAQAERILDEAGAQAGTEAPQPAASPSRWTTTKAPRGRRTASGSISQSGSVDGAAGGAGRAPGTCMASGGGSSWRAMRS